MVCLFSAVIFALNLAFIDRYEREREEDIRPEFLSYNNKLKLDEGINQSLERFNKGQ